MTTRLNLESWAITKTCRANKDADGAWDEAVSHLRQVYDAQLARWPDVTLTLSIARDAPAG